MLPAVTRTDELGFALGRHFEIGSDLLFSREDLSANVKSPGEALP